MPIPPHVLIDSLSIVLIDLLLAGDNALVIALAVRSLPAPQRRTALILGAAGAVVLRVAITFLAAEFLYIQYVKMVGGAFVVWIAVKVFSDTSSPEAKPEPGGHVLRAIGYIVFADLTMSTDNILAIAAASKGSVALIIFGLCVSIPFVVLSSGLLVKLLDGYPWLLYLGVVILGKVGAEMILTDPFVDRMLHPSTRGIYLGETLVVIAVLIASRLLASRRSGAEAG